MSVYEDILNHKEYQEVVNRIEQMKFISDGKWDWEHGLAHYQRVANFTKKILTQLQADERTIELAMVAALLHDIGLSESSQTKKAHAIMSAKLFRSFISHTNITKEEEAILEAAIADHSNGNDINSLVALALVLADKLDVTYHRTQHSSIQDEMNKEIQKIRDVDIIINEEVLIVHYKTVDNFNVNILKDWEKAITIPQKVADILHKKNIFLINHKEIHWKVIK